MCRRQTTEFNRVREVEYRETIVKNNSSGFSSFEQVPLTTSSSFVQVCWDLSGEVRSGLSVIHSISYGQLYISLVLALF